jgi:hypothetical protein
LKKCKPPVFDNIPAALAQGGGKTMRSEIHKLIKVTWNKKELPYQWEESTVIPIHRKSDKID